MTDEEVIAEASLDTGWEIKWLVATQPDGSHIILMRPVKRLNETEYVVKVNATFRQIAPADKVYHSQAEAAARVRTLTEST